MDLFIRSVRGFCYCPLAVRRVDLCNPSIQRTLTTFLLLGSRFQLTPSNSFSSLRRHTLVSLLQRCAVDAVTTTMVGERNATEAESFEMVVSAKGNKKRRDKTYNNDKLKRIQLPVVAFLSSNFFLPTSLPVSFASFFLCCFYFL